MNLLITYLANNTVLLLGNHDFTTVIVGHGHNIFQAESLKRTCFTAVTGCKLLELLTIKHFAQFLVELIDSIHR